MDERPYDPAFAVRATPNHVGECQFVRTSHFFETCTLPGCRIGRYSHEWINGLKSAPSATPDSGKP